jgi:hydrogenase maturation factor
MTALDSLAPPVTDVPAQGLASAAFSLARRFAAGSSLWCVAPKWPAHGRHIAVEFVHPVIMGKRALPALNVEGADTIKALRLMARAGDAVVVVSTHDDPVSIELLRRAEAWGLTRIWLGAGQPPSSGLAEHVVWLNNTEPNWAARSGDMVLMYHLLWELTHVVLEHKGLLDVAPECADEICITCSDQGQVAEVQSAPTQGLVDVLVAGSRATVDASLVDNVTPGDLLLVHAGVALAMLAERER